VKLVAITSCPSGIAHTYMAAEALSIAANEMGYDIKVETHGSIGIENIITNEDLIDAKAVIIAADIKVDKTRFKGLPILEVSVREAIKDAKGLISRALEIQPMIVREKVVPINSNSTKSSYNHLMTGISFIIPFIVISGVLLSLYSVFEQSNMIKDNSLAAALMIIGRDGAFGLILPILAGYIAFSIADKPALAPGLIGGYFCKTLGAGFLGAILTGFLAGYIVYMIKKFIKLPVLIDSLLPGIILPVLSTLIVALITIFIIASPLKIVNDYLSNWIHTLKGVPAFFCALVLGLMMSFDLGGPVNKIAYTFAIATLTISHSSSIMAAVMAAGMTPPLGMALAVTIAGKKFTLEERKAAKIAWIQGLTFITEGAIPFTHSDRRVKFSIMIGSAVASLLSVIWGCTLALPHGGVFVLWIPNAVNGLFPYLLSIAVGAVTTALIASASKKSK
jgi:fructose PTS system EIIBC or EIIC component